MSDKIIAATLNNLSSVPKGAVFQGEGIFEFTVEKDPVNIEHKLAELDVANKLFFKDKSIKDLKLKSDDEAKKDNSIKAFEKVEDFQKEKDKIKPPKPKQLDAGADGAEVEDAVIIEEVKIAEPEPAEPAQPVVPEEVKP